MFPLNISQYTELHWCNSTVPFTCAATAKDDDRLILVDNYLYLCRRDHILSWVHVENVVRASSVPLVEHLKLVLIPHLLYIIILRHTQSSIYAAGMKEHLKDEKSLLVFAVVFKCF